MGDDPRKVTRKVQERLDKAKKASIRRGVPVSLRDYVELTRVQWSLFEAIMREVGSNAAH